MHAAAQICDRICGLMNRLALAQLSVLSLVVSLLVVAAAPHASADADPPIPGDPSVVVASGTPLPFNESPSGGDIVVDDAHGRVFVSGGQGNTGVVVADLDGQIVQTIPDLAGASGLLLSEDGATLYAALADAKAIAAIDTATLVTRTFAAGDSCPRYLTELGAYVYFTESCFDFNFRLMRLDPLTGGIDPVTLVDEEDQFFRSSGPLATHASQPGRIFLADNEYASCCRPSNAVSTFEVDGLTATRVATMVRFVQHVYGLDFLSDGSELIVAGDGLTALDPPYLSVIRDSYPSNICCSTFSVSASGEHVASARTNTVGSNTRIVIHDRAGEYVRSYPFDANTYLGLNGVELSSDRVFAVTWHDDDSIRLHTLTDATTPAPLIYLGVISDSNIGEPVHLDGTATLSGQPFAGRQLTAWRSGPDGLVQLPPIVTAADGTFTIDDSPTRWGGYRYSVISPAAPGLAPEKDEAFHRVQGVRTGISLERPVVSAPGRPVVVRGRLTTTSTSNPIAGARITATHTHAGETTALAPTVTGADGGFTLEVDGATLGEHVFNVAYEGDSTFLPSASQVSTWVKHDVVIELTGLDSPYLMREEPVTLNGRLRTAEGEPLPQQTVYWEQRRTQSGAPAVSGTMVTDADGGFTIDDAPCCSGQTRWVVQYRGDDTHQTALSEAAVPVYQYRPEIAITTDRTQYEYDTDAEVTVRLPESAYGTIRVFMEPHGLQPRLVAVRSSVEVAEVLRLTRNTTVSAVYEPRTGWFRYAPGTASVAIPVVPAMRQSLSGWYAKDGAVHLVRTGVDPLLKVTTKPSLSGKCVRARVERFRNGAYRFVKRSLCLRLSQTSTADWAVRGDPPAGTRFRVRYEWAGSPTYSPRNATWTYLRFTRRGTR